MKKWKFNEETKELSEVAAIPQFEGAEEVVDRQLCGLVCFSENDTIHTVAVNMQGDLILTANWAVTEIIPGLKNRVNTMSIAGAD